MGEVGYYDKARRECEQFMIAIRRKCGEAPPGAYLYIKHNQHDFGTYLEVAVKYESDNEAACAYAYKVEAEAPSEWDILDKIALGLER